LAQYRPFAAIETALLAPTHGVRLRLTLQASLHCLQVVSLMSAALCARQAPFALRTAFTPALPARGAAAPLRRAMPPRRRPAPAAAAASGSTPAVPAVPAAGGDGVQGDMLHPSTANNPAVRLLAITAVVAAAARSTGFLPATGLAFVHVLAYGTWLGTLAWTSFVFGIVAFRNLPRQTFGRLQSKLFPK
jgi:hypothetical protein